METMGAGGRRTTNSLERQLFEDGHEFDFFQAVRLLLRLFPEQQRVGNDAKPSEEVVRFGSRVSLEFPASAIHQIAKPKQPETPAHMTVTFFGLMGTQGVLPFHYTEWMLAREAAKDTAMAEFFDLFNHRWISLLYKVWEKHRLPVAYERGALESRPAERIDRYVFDLIGMGTKGLRSRMRIADEVLLLYAGLITQRPRSASALRGVLHDYFGVGVEIRQCLGRWYPLQERDRCYLNNFELRNQLGEGAVAGDAVWDPQSRFRIRLGPLSMDRFRAFLPGEPALRELLDLTRFFVGLSILFDVQLVLEAQAVPICELRDEPDAAPRLGWNTWLKTAEFLYDADDATFAEAA